MAYAAREHLHSRGGSFASSLVFDDACTIRAGPSWRCAYASIFCVLGAAVVEAVVEEFVEELVEEFAGLAATGFASDGLGKVSNSFALVALLAFVRGSVCPSED